MRFLPTWPQQLRSSGRDTRGDAVDVPRRFLALSCPMITHKNPGWRQLATAGLRSRRAALVAALPQAGGLLPGALVEQHRSCGKERCRCARGEPHGPYVYLQVGGHLVYVPAGLAETVWLCQPHLDLARIS